MAKKFGMAAASKAPEKKRTDHSLSMMLHRQAQVAKAKAAGTLTADSGTGAKRKAEKTVEVGIDDLLADFDAPATVPKKKQSTLPRLVPKVSSHSRAQGGAQTCFVQRTYALCAAVTFTLQPLKPLATCACVPALIACLFVHACMQTADEWLYALQSAARPGTAGLRHANGALLSPMDSKKRPTVPQRKQILARGAFGVVKTEPVLAEVSASVAWYLP